LNEAFPIDVIGLAAKALGQKQFPDPRLAQSYRAGVEVTLGS
jgi:hypothetical protein